MAYHLRCSERQIDLLRNVLPTTIRVGTVPRWSRAAVVQWIEQQEKENREIR